MDSDVEPIRWLWGVSVAFSLFSIWYYWRFTRNLPGVRETRLGGVKDKASWLLYGLVWVAGTYYLFDLVSAWQSLPLWADGIALGLLVLCGAFVVRLLKNNPKFNFAKIRKLWLNPLGVSCVGLSVFMKVGDQTPVVAAKAAATVSGLPIIGKLVDDAAQGLISAVTTAIGKPRSGRSLATDTLIGVVGFRNSLEKGSIGDRVCHKIFGGMKHTKHNSKFKGTKGIDAVYTYTDAAGHQHLNIVENKIKGSSLSKGQMSDDWVATKLKEMQQYGDKNVRETAAMIREAQSSASAVKVHKVLLEHNLRNGLIECFDVSADGTKGVILWEKNCESTMRGVLQEYQQRLAAGDGAVDEVVEDALTSY
jgi:hypothetical protein